MPLAKKNSCSHYNYFKTKNIFVELSENSTFYMGMAELGLMHQSSCQMWQKGLNYQPIAIITHV